MIFKLKLEMNDAVRDADDVAALLAEAIPRVAAKVGEDGEFGLIRDANGNRIGRWDFSNVNSEEFVVGEEDTTKDGDRDCGHCFYDEDGDLMWNCTRDDGHSGVHAGGNSRVIVAIWHDVND